MNQTVADRVSSVTDKKEKEKEILITKWGLGGWCVFMWAGLFRTYPNLSQSELATVRCSLGFVWALYYDA